MKTLALVTGLGMSIPTMIFSALYGMNFKNNDIRMPLDLSPYQPFATHAQKTDTSI